MKYEIKCNFYYKLHSRQKTFKNQNCEFLRCLIFLNLKAEVFSNQFF